MELVIVNDYATVNGGSSFVAITSARALAARGFPVTYFSAVGPVDPLLQDVPNLTVVCLGQAEIVNDPNRPRAIVNGVINRSAAAAFAALLRQKKAADTVVHVHTFTKALSSATIDVALRAGFPVALTLHDFFITCPTGGFFVHKDAALCRRTPLSLDCLTTNCDRRNVFHKVWRTARTIVQNRVLHLDRRISHYIGVSQHSLEVMRPYLPPEVPVTIVRNPIEVADRGAADAGRNTAFTYVGRFSLEKGPLLFAEALSGTDLPGVFVGDGELRAACEQAAPQAEFVGWLPGDQVTARLRQARALVFPPLWYETLGLVVIEAAASGIPAIVSSRCAATDFVRDGVTGLIFEHGSAASLREKMRQMQDAKFAAALGKNAYQWYWQNPWTPENHIGELIPVYESLLYEYSAS